MATGKAWRAITTGWLTQQRNQVVSNPWGHRPVETGHAAAGLTREHVLHALADLDAGLSPSFGSSAGVELVHDARRYDPKTVIGVACRHSIDGMLRADEFSDDEDANKRFRHEALQVVACARRAPKRAKKAPRDRR